MFSCWPSTQNVGLLNSMLWSCFIEEAVYWLQEAHPFSNQQSKESNLGSPQLRFSSPCIPDPCSQPVCPGLPGGHLCMEGFPFLGRDTDSQAFHENRCLMECSGRLLWFTWKLFREDLMTQPLPASHHTTLFTVSSCSSPPRASQMAQW